MSQSSIGFNPYEINYLINHQDINIELLSKSLNKSRKDILFIQKSLGIKSQRATFWTIEEERFLKKNYHKYNTEDLAIKMNRSVSSIKHKAQRLNLLGERKLVRNPYAKDWTVEEEQYLINNKTKSIEQLANELGRTKNSVLAKFTRLGLRKPYHKFWTKKEDLYLENNIGVKTYAEIGKKLKRTPRSCAARANKLHLESFDREYSAADIARAFKVNRSNVVITWMKHNGLPAEKKRKGEQVYYSIKGEDFWEWYSNHKELVPIKTYDFGSVLPEPEYIQKLED